MILDELVTVCLPRPALTTWCRTAHHHTHDEPTWLQQLATQTDTTPDTGEAEITLTFRQWLQTWACVAPHWRTFLEDYHDVAMPLLHELLKHGWGYIYYDEYEDPRTGQWVPNHATPRPDHGPTVEVPGPWADYLVFNVELTFWEDDVDLMAQDENDNPLPYRTLKAVWAGGDSVNQQLLDQDFTPSDDTSRRTVTVTLTLAQWLLQLKYVIETAHRHPYGLLGDPSVHERMGTRILTALATS